jgi:hypothetical protein
MVLYHLQHDDEDAKAVGLDLDWVRSFTRAELKALWDDICENPNYPYDDEVHEALYRLNYFA